MSGTGSGEGRSGFAAFWSSLPGMISAVAALIAALATAGVFVVRGSGADGAGAAAISPTTPSRAPPVTTTATAVPPATSAVTVAAASHAGSPPVTPRPTTRAPVTRAAPVDVALVVGIRPDLGQQSESMDLDINGVTVASWTSDLTQPSLTFPLHLPPGKQRWTLSGEYTYQNALGIDLTDPVTGSGTLTVTAGTTYGIWYLHGDVFQLRAFG
jgi:hypothetical protein